MTVKTRWVFDCRIHPEYGGLGWVLSNMPAFDPLSGMAVAHDVLEHIPNDDSTTGELMAFGAMIYVRSGYFRNGSPAYNFSGELGDLMLKIHYKEWVSLREFPRVFPVVPYQIECEIQEGIKLASEYLEKDRESEYTLTPQDIHNIQGWMRTGYLKAVRRYKHVARYALLDLFREIEEQADSLLKHAEEGITQLVVSLRYESALLQDLKEPILKVYTKENYGNGY